MKPILLSATLLIGALYAIDAPPMKEGLWSIRTQSTNNPGNTKGGSTKSLCRNHAYDAQAQGAVKEAQSMCKTLHESTSGAVMTIETECKMGGSVIHSKGTATIINENSTRTETHATYTPAMYGLSETTMIMEQKFAGACPAGVKPGEYVGADGNGIRGRVR